MPNLAGIIFKKYKLPKLNLQSAVVGCVGFTTTQIYTMLEVHVWIRAHICIPY